MGGDVNLRAIGPRAEAALAFAAGALVLLASLANLLLFNRYPLLTVEVALLMAAIAALAAAMVPIYLGQRPWGKAFLAGLLVFVAVDLNTESVAAAMVLAVAAAVASWKMGPGLLRFLSLIAIVALVTSLLGLTERSAAVSVAKQQSQASPVAKAAPDAPAAPPLVVHIILDEMGGLAGLREMDGGRSRFADEARRTLVNAGFAVDALAFTPWPNTIRSVPAALNYNRRASIDGTVDDGGAMGRVAMLRDLRQRGYDLRLWQTSYLDFCAANPFDECVTSNVNHLRVLRETNLPASDRALVIGANLIAQSKFGRFVFDGLDAALVSVGATSFDDALPPFLMQRRYVSTIHGEATLRRLAEELRTARPGTAYVAHVLLPHYPFAYNSDCSLRRFGEWEPPWGRRPIERRWKRYEQQYRCAMRRILDIASAVDRSAGGANAVLVVHGDHGPRVRDQSLEDDPSIERTLLSTLFAVRRGGQGGSMLERQCPIGTLVAATVRSEAAAQSCTRQFFLERDEKFVAQPVGDWTRPIERNQ